MSRVQIFLTWFNELFFKTLFFNCLHEMQINLNLVEAKVQTFYSESSCVWDANWSMLVAEAELLKLSSYGVW